MKIYVDADSQYPVYSLTRERQYSFQDEIELTEEEVARCESAIKEFNEITRIISKKVEALFDKKV